MTSPPPCRSVQLRVAAVLVGMLLFTADIYPGSALHKAIRKGDPDKAQKLIKRGASVDEFDGRGYRPLHWAAHLTGPNRGR